MQRVPLLIVAFGLLGLVAAPSIAQRVKDPFGSGRQTQENPFEAPSKKRKLTSEEELVRMDGKLKQALDQKVRLQQQLAANLEVQHALRRKVLETEVVLRMHHDFQNLFIQRLLASEDANQQMIGIKYVVDACKFFEDDSPLLPAAEVVGQLTMMVDSDSAEIRKASVNALIAYDPNAARQLGFQVGTWLPLTGARAREIRQALQKQARFDYFETRLADIVDELKADYRSQISIDPEVDVESAITLTTSNVTLQTALEQLLAKQNLTFVVRENDLLILPKNDPAAKISLTYNVRGLLTDQLTMEGLVKLINKIITDDKSEEELKFDFHVREIDQNRLIIVGTEREQARVASLLNSLAPKR